MYGFGRRQQKLHANFNNGFTGGQGGGGGLQPQQLQQLIAPIVQQVTQQVLTQLQGGFGGLQAGGFGAGNVGGGKRRRGKKNRQNMLGSQGFSAAFSGQQGGGGSYAGVGPRNFRQDDQMLTQNVCMLLAQHPAIDASNIDVQVRAGEITLAGSVPDIRTKKLVWNTLVSQFSGVQILDQLRVANIENGSYINRGPNSRNAGSPLIHASS